MTKAYNLSIEKFDPCKVVMHFSESLIKAAFCRASSHDF